jgi:hypothetical protein
MNPTLAQISKTSYISLTFVTDIAEAYAAMLDLHPPDAFCLQIHYTHGPAICGESKSLLVLTNRYLRVSSQRK